jgi:hypothetical protein
VNHDKIDEESKAKSPYKNNPFMDSPSGNNIMNQSMGSFGNTSF